MAPSAAREKTALLVIGGGPAGRSAAVSYRDRGGQGRVLLLSADAQLPYFRPALSKDYLRGDTELAGIGLADARDYAVAGIDVWLNQTVTAIDGPRQVVTLGDGTLVRYDSCVLATGATPAVPPIPGADDERVAYLRSARDASWLRSAVERAGRVVVIGSGFIGCEAAATLRDRGLDVTMVSAEALPQRERLGERAGRRMAGWLEEAGVRLIAGASVTAIEDATTVRLDGHAPVRGDLVLVAAGIQPVVAPVAGQPGVRVDRGRVVVSASMWTGVPGLYAAGDVVYARNARLGRHLAVEHWGEAVAMGEVAGACCAGATREWARAPGFWSEIGPHALKYVAWGDGYQQERFDDHGDGAFTVWYLTEGRVVGVLTHRADDDYERGRELVESAARLDAA